MAESKRAARFKLPEPVCSGWTWDDAVEALKAGGFEMVALRFAPEVDWAGRWGDNEGPAPLPKDPAKGRWFALMLRPDGLLARLNSTQGGYPREAGQRRPRGWSEEGFDRYFHELNTLDLRAEVDCGASLSREATLSSVSWTGDGSWRAHMDANAVTGGADLRSLVKNWTAMGRLVEAGQWRDTREWLDPGFYTDAPLAGSAADFETGREAFAARIERELDAFVEGLPAPLRPVFENQSLLRRTKSKEKEPLGSRAWNRYASESLQALGLKAADPLEAALLIDWGRQVEAAEARREPKVDWDARVLGGATFLHALARSDMDGGSPREGHLAWLERLDSEQVKALGEARDALGATAAGWAFSEALNSASVWGGSPFKGLLGWMAQRGLAGAPGEWARLAAEELESMAARGAAAPKPNQGWDQAAVEMLEWARSQNPKGWAGEGEQGLQALSRLARAAKGLGLGDWSQALLEQSEIEMSTPRAAESAPKPRL